MSVSNIATSCVSTSVTRADIAELSSEIKTLASEIRAQLKLLVYLVCGLHLGFMMLIIDKFVG